jgi:hypothetical protein
MTCVHIDRPISWVFFGSLFPICSRFVPSLRWNDPLNWHSRDGHTLRERKQEWKEESDIVFWLRKHDGLVRCLRVRAASSVSLRSLMPTDFPQTIRDNFRVADNTPRALVFCFPQPCFRPARALLQLRELSGRGAIEAKSERRISALDICNIPPTVTTPDLKPPKQEGRKPAPGCSLCLSAVRSGVEASRLHDHSWRPCLPDFIQTVPRSPLRTRSGKPRPWYPRIALVHPLSTGPARWGIRLFA